jgi:hypothetical protein
MARNPWVAKWDVASYSDPDKEYTVAVRKDGTWGCSCPRWKFRRADLPNGECKHIEFLKDAIEGNLNGTRTPDEVSDQVAWDSILVEMLGLEGHPGPWTKKTKPQRAKSDLVLARKVRTRAGFIEL